MKDKILEKDKSGKWNTSPPVPDDKINNVNCHKLVLHILGIISWEEMTENFQEKSGYNSDFTYGVSAKGISEIPFEVVNNFDTLLNLADKNCKVDDLYAGQVLDAKTGEMAHSFIVIRDKNNKYQCFDKPGFKYPFSVHDIEAVFNFVNKDGEKSYHNQMWRFVPMIIK